MAKVVMRFQCDPYGQDDPVVTVYLGEERIDADTGDALPPVMDTVNPVQVKRSELKSFADLFDIGKLGPIHAASKVAAKQVRIEAAAKAAKAGELEAEADPREIVR